MAAQPSEMRKLTMVKAINLALHQEMERDDDVMILGEDVGIDEGVFRVTEGLLKKFGEQRVIVVRKHAGQAAPGHQAHQRHQRQRY